MVFKIQNRFFSSNTYLIRASVGSDCIIIDPGLDAENIYKTIIDNNLFPVGIICTHGHFDHIASVAFIKKKFGDIPYYLHKADAKMAKSANFYLKLTKVKYWIDYIAPDIFFVNEVEEIKIRDFEFKVFHFPGHSDGSCIVKYNDFLFTGDILYKTGLGFNNFPGENRHLLKVSIKKIFNSFDKGILVYPGHGESDYLGRIAENNFELFNFLNN